MNKDETVEFIEKENQINLLKKMQQEVTYNLFTVNQTLMLDSSLDSAAKKIPMLSKFIRTIDTAGEAVANIGERASAIHTSLSSESISHGFHFGAVAIAGLDFIRIPLIYLIAFVLKVKIPFTINNNARWFYSGLILGLVITALAVPVTAPFIGFTASGIGLVVGSFLLTKTLYQRAQLGRKNRQIKNELKIEDNQMRLIQQKASKLECLLTDAKDEKSRVEVYHEITLVQERFELQKQRIETLKYKEHQLAQKIEQLNIIKVLDRSIGVILAAASIIGLVLTLFFPPLGSGILLGVSIVGGAYIFSRITAPLFNYLGHWIVDKFKSLIINDTLNQDVLEEDRLVNPKKDLSSEHDVNTFQADMVPDENQVINTEPVKEEYIHESTADVFSRLGITKSSGVDLDNSKSDDEDDNDIARFPKGSNEPVSNTVLHIEETDGGEKSDEDKDGEGRTETGVDRP